MSNTLLATANCAKCNDLYYADRLIQHWCPKCIKAELNYSTGETYQTKDYEGDELTVVDHQEKFLLETLASANGFEAVKMISEKQYKILRESFGMNPMLIDKLTSKEASDLISSKISAMNPK